MLHFSRPETDEEVFQISGSEQDVVELVKVVARMLPHSIDWEIKNEQLDIPDMHMGRWSCDLKPIGRVDENLVARLDREWAGQLTERIEDGR